MKKSLAVAAIHVLLVGSLGAKLVVDRAVRPRVWARTAPFDPSLPIRGRYVRLRLEAALDRPPASRDRYPVRVTLSAREGRLVATAADGPLGLPARAMDRGGEPVAIIDQPLAYFIPEHIVDPSRRAVGEELWVEVTLPRAGAPRPIRLGVKKDGVLTPIDLN